LVEDEEIEERL